MLKFFKFVFPAVSLIFANCSRDLLIMRLYEGIEKKEAEVSIIESRCIDTVDGARMPLGKDQEIHLLPGTHVIGVLGPYIGSVINGRWNIQYKDTALVNIQVLAGHKYRIWWQEGPIYKTDKDEIFITNYFKSYKIYMYDITEKKTVLRKKVKGLK